MVVVVVVVLVLVVVVVMVVVVVVVVVVVAVVVVVVVVVTATCALMLFGTYKCLAVVRPVSDLLPALQNWNNLPSSLCVPSLTLTLFRSKLETSLRFGPRRALIPV